MSPHASRTLADALSFFSGPGNHLNRAPEGLQPHPSTRDEGYPIYSNEGISGWAEQPCVDGPCIIVSQAGATAGQVWFEPGDCWAIMNTKVIVPATESVPEGITPEDLTAITAFWFAYLEYLDLKRFNQGSAQRHPRWKSIMEQPAPDVPLDQQIRLGRFITTLLAAERHQKETAALTRELAMAFYVEAAQNCSHRATLGDEVNFYSMTFKSPARKPDGSAPEPVDGLRLLLGQSGVHNTIRLTDEPDPIPGSWFHVEPLRLPLAVVEQMLRTLPLERLHRGSTIRVLNQALLTKLEIPVFTEAQATALNERLTALRNLAISLEAEAGQLHEARRGIFRALI